MFHKLTDKITDKLFDKAYEAAKPHVIEAKEKLKAKYEYYQEHPEEVQEIIKNKLLI